MINQGDIFWIDGNRIETGELGVHPHPYIVLQENVFNHSRLETVIVCVLTTNLKHANSYGNVLLEDGEANLPKASVVVVSKVSAIKKSLLGGYIGSLSSQRIAQILAGMRMLNASFRK